MKDDEILKEFRKENDYEMFEPIKLDIAVLELMKRARQSERKSKDKGFLEFLKDTLRNASKERRSVTYEELNKKIAEMQEEEKAKEQKQLLISTNENQISSQKLQEKEKTR